MSGPERASSRLVSPGRTTALIVGISATQLTEDERSFLGRHDPLGVILFARNIVDAPQLRRLIGTIREALGRAQAPILIDQEGGRVARLGPPHWPVFPPAARFGALYHRDAEAARQACWLNHAALGVMLAALGITVDCAPVLDVPVAGADPIIGDRAFAGDPAIVADLAASACAGLRAAGVLPVIKHVPGHGRADLDSHLALPRVDASLADLQASDFAAFRLCDAGPAWAMTAHVVFSAIDADRPATLSSPVMQEVVRPLIGERLVMSDDISMHALSGDFAARARAALDAGCDVILHCNGDPEERDALASAVPVMPEQAIARLGALPMADALQPFDVLIAERDRLMAASADG